MCDAASSSEPDGTIPRPRWGALYGMVVLGIAALTSIDVAVPVIERSALEMTVVGGAFVAMALWLRSNRAALDQQDWCACAGGKTTMRVIASRRPQTTAPPAMPVYPPAEENLEEAPVGR
jgi:hypothetical protein